MTFKFPAIDIADRDDGRILYWDDGDNIHKYKDEAGGTALSITQVYRSTAQNVSGNGTLTSISFDTEIEDTHGVWAIGTPTQFIIPAGLDGRRAIVKGSIVWTTSNAGTYRGLYLRKDAANIERVLNVGVSNVLGVAQQVTSKILTLATGETFELQMRADTTGIGTIGGILTADLTLYTVD